LQGQAISSHQIDYLTGEENPPTCCQAFISDLQVRTLKKNKSLKGGGEEATEGLKTGKGCVRRGSSEEEKAPAVLSV